MGGAPLPRAASWRGESRAANRLRAPLLELSLASIDHLGQRPQPRDHLGVEPPVHADRGDCFTASLQTGLVILADVDARVAKQRTDTTNHARNVAIPENHERPLRHHIDVVLSNAHDARMAATEKRPRYAHLALTTRRAKLDVLRERRMGTKPRAPDVEPARFREMAGIHEVDIAASNDRRQKPYQRRGGQRS